MSSSNSEMPDPAGRDSSPAAPLAQHAGLSPDKMAAVEALIEDHILPKLDPDFLEYFAEIQARLGSQQQAVSNPSIDHLRSHPEAYRSPCALDTSGYPRVADLTCPSQDGIDIPVRVYHPDLAKHGSGPYPVHLNFHGQFVAPLQPA